MQWAVVRQVRIQELLIIVFISAEEIDEVKLAENDVLGWHPGLFKPIAHGLSLPANAVARYGASSEDLGAVSIDRTQSNAPPI